MKKIVIKIGTKVLTDKNSALDENVIQDLVKQICKILNSKVDILLVSSGAIGAGMGLLGIKKRPESLAELQSMASIGQTALMNIYNKYFIKEGCHTGQILLTQDDFDDRMRYLNIRYTINTLLRHKAIPIVNENDTISTEEIKCGDNDRLSSLVADLVEADALIILTDVDGLLDKKGNLMEKVETITRDIMSLAKKCSSNMGTGGMDTKIKAAEFCMNSGIECYIANGRTKNILLDIIDGKGRYTHFKAKSSKMTAKKRWIGFSSKVKGKLILDDGAKDALLKKNKSLLSAGIIAKKGDFRAGDTISICDKDEKEFARGLINYSSNEISKIKGIKTSDIESILGYKEHDEVVHRDNLVIL